MQKCVPIMNACEPEEECFCVQNQICVIQRVKAKDRNQSESDFSLYGIPKWTGLPKENFDPPTNRLTNQFSQNPVRNGFF
ncbi:unnamed protein product, partial [Mesorhabditis belari]